MLVVFYHLQNIFMTHCGVVPLGGVFTAGNRGVDLFFVLSGFVIMMVHADDIGRPQRVVRYLYKRVCRIYPSVWITTAAAAVLYDLHFGGAAKGFKLQAAHFAASALLLPQRGPPLVNVTWTLAYEVSFYAIFALLIARRRIGLPLVLAWQATVALISVGLLPLAPPPSVIWLRPLCLEFGIGMLGALIVRSRHSAGRWPVRLSAAGVLAGTTLFVAGMALETGQDPATLEPVRVAIYGVASGVVIVGLTILEREWRWQAAVPLVRLGQASYAIYLVHFSVITLAAVAIAHLKLRVIGDVVMLGCALLAVACGYAFHALVDQPLQMALRRLGGRLFERRATSGLLELRSSALPR